MLESAFNFIKGLFVHPEGGINWRTILIAGGGLLVGSSFGIMGALLGAAVGVAASAAWDYIGPPAGATTTQPPVAPPAQPQAVASAPQMQITPPQGLPMGTTPPGRGA